MNASDVKEEGRRICEDVGSESCTESLSDWCYDCSDNRIFSLLADLRPYLHLWWRALDSDQKNKIADKSSNNELSPKAGWPLR